MTRIFISYAHNDEDLKKELEKHLSELERQGIVTPWSDEQIQPGEELDSAIQKKLERADIILLLVSPDFLASTYCREVETVKALEQGDTRGSITIPVILRPCDWHRAPFGRLKALPKDGKPVVQYPSRDEAFLEIAKALGRICQSKNRSQQAIEHYTEAIELNPQMALAYYNRGNANSVMENYEEALEDYSKAIQLYPDYSDSFFNRANAKADIYRFQEAINDYDEAFRLGSKNALFNKGNALVFLGRFDEALRCYRESELKGMDNGVALENRRALEMVIRIISNRKYTTKKYKDLSGVSVSVSVDGYDDNIEFNQPFQGRVGNAGNFPSGEGFPGGAGFFVKIVPSSTAAESSQRFFSSGLF